MPYQPEGRPCQAPEPHNGFTYDTADGRCLCLHHVVQLKADMSPTTEARLMDISAAVDFLEQYLSDASEHRPDRMAWLERLTARLGSLDLTDPRIVTIEECMRPILDYDEAFNDAVMYPSGRTQAFLESAGDGDIDASLTAFIAALRDDYDAWVRADAEWFADRSSTARHATR